ncbi:MAG: Putative RNA helicase [Heterodermia speciosa]|uniref:RNA helicase n=1 Tax=Heterodermia speciosa TaxID=116794 RepID=A0A8H3EMI8_9LECA|nr:MAG: Putative RNA helicase [Heterodermia speciosa]
MAQSTAPLSVSSSTRQESSSSPSSSGEELSNPSRKRKRATSSHLPPEDPTPPSARLSRIQPKTPAAAASVAAELITPSISNGKLVDASLSFATLEVAPWLIASLGAMAVTRPTGIQKACIPKILDGRDVIGGSRTGSGKTIAFSVPMLQKWAEDPVGIFAVILTPTRELALQIFEQIKAISAPQSLKPILVTGGTDMRPQALALAQRPHVVIATPGRLADHIQTSGNDTIMGLRRTRMVVLDEADRLLASGPGSMLPDVEVCLSVLPPSHERQTCLFTATVTPEVTALKNLPRQKNKPPVFVCEVDTAELAVPSTLHQTYLQVPVTYREAYLHILLLTARNAAKKSVMVFCNRTSTANLLERLLRLLEHRVTSLHSLLPQHERTSNLARFRASAARILVATDVASRGLDIPEVELVVNYDVPRNPDDYIHRVGRTARAGKGGEAITLVGQRDVALFLAIEARVGAKMSAFEEKGVNIETRVVRDGLKDVGERKREALLAIDEGRDVKGNRTRGKIRRLE